MGVPIPKGPHLQLFMCKIYHWGGGYRSFKVLAKYKLPMVESGGHDRLSSVSNALV